MTLHETKQYLQSFFSDGLVTVIGSGLSAAAGLPGMFDLATHLRAAIPLRCQEGMKDWAPVEARLNGGEGLEAALTDLDLESPLIPCIVSATAELIEAAEQRAIKSVLTGQGELPLRRLMPHLTFSEGASHIITPNYDRLIEVAAELAGLAVDTGFAGYSYALHNPSAVRESLSYFEPRARVPYVKRRLRAHIRLHKPHGSLDWYLHGVTPVRCAFSLQGMRRLMVTPGGSKFRRGYESPFDIHRAEANTAIDRANRFLVIGYGFNDEQLETHLRARLEQGAPCVLLTRGLTPNAEAVTKACPSILSIAALGTGTTGARCRYSGQEWDLNGVPLWDLDTFITEIF